jgi:hypothetical protein
MNSLSYLDPDSVVATKRTIAPRNRSVTGYGSKIPTSLMLQLPSEQGNRWHRVYVICYSNIGTAYVLVNGEPIYLGSYDPDHDPKGTK